MNNLIEINFKAVKPTVSTIGNTKRELTISSLSKAICCIDCGVSHAVMPIASNGYCVICNHINQHVISY